MLKKLVLGIFISFLLAGCAEEIINLSEGAKTVRVGKSDPTDNYSEIGPITASSGRGCGAFGTTGTYDQTIVALQNLAYKKGGDYVQLVTISEPHLENGCHVQAYTISGTLFKNTNKSTKSAHAATISDKPSVTDRLKELDTLHKNGAINDDEYEIKRQEILKSL